MNNIKSKVYKPVYDYAGKQLNKEINDHSLKQVRVHLQNQVYGQVWRQVWRQVLLNEKS